MLKVLIPAAALLGLVALAAQPAELGYERHTDLQTMGWHLYQEEAMAKLAYGVANSDQLALMLTCEPGDRGAVVYGEVQPASARLMRVSHDYVEADPLSMGDAYETRIALNDAALVRLAERGSMPVEGAAGAFTLPATAGERAAVARFISYCASGRA